MKMKNNTMDKMIIRIKTKRLRELERLVEKFSLARISQFEGIQEEIEKKHNNKR